VKLVRYGDVEAFYRFLFTNQNNPTSNHIYQTIGYRHVSDVTVYDFETGVAGGDIDG
jgi:hypothetical protein